MAVEITVQGKAKKHPRVKEIKEEIRKNLATLYRALDLRSPELSVVLTDDAHIQALNRDWRAEDKATDVLSFPLFEADEIGDDIPALGDIVISVEYAERLVASGEHQARVAAELGVDPALLAWGLIEEVRFLFIHGLLHLVGHDHEHPEDEIEMKAEERRLFELFK